MNEHESTEIAYKNGFEAGVKAFAERLRAVASLGDFPWDDERVYVCQIDEIEKELTK